MIERRLFKPHPVEHFTADASDVNVLTAISKFSSSFDHCHVEAVMA